MLLCTPGVSLVVSYTIACDGACFAIIDLQKLIITAIIVIILCRVDDAACLIVYLFVGRMGLLDARGLLRASSVFVAGDMLC